VIPIIIEFSLELVFPVGEGTTVGLLYAAREVWSFVLGAIMSMVYDKDK
jgi:hypothetical protein